jgi:uncharacterized membrane protein
MVLRACLTGGFCAVLAFGVSRVAPELTLAQLLAMSFVSGFLGSIFASLVLKQRKRIGDQAD